MPPNAPTFSPYLLVLVYALALVIAVFLVTAVVRPFLPPPDLPRRDADLARDEEARRRAMKKANDSPTTSTRR